MTAKVQMMPESRFGTLMAEAVQKQGISLRTLAVKLDYSYEQLRKIWQGQSSPGEDLRHRLSEILKIDPDTADKAVIADQMQRKHGAGAYNVLGRDPRIADIEPLLPQLTKAEWGMFVTQIRAVVQAKMKKG